MEAEQQSLIEQAKAGNEHAFLALMKRYASMILAIIRSFMYNIVGYEDEDLYQEIMLKAYEVMPKFRGDETAFRYWLQRSTRGVCLNLLDAQRRQETVSSEGICGTSLLDSLPSPYPDPRKTFERTVLCDSLHQAFNDLSEDFRKIVLLKDVEGLRYREIADLLGIEEGTVKSRLSRARNELQQHLKVYQ